MSALTTACEVIGLLRLRIEEQRKVLRLVDDDVRHHLRSGIIAPAMIRPKAVQAVRDVLNK